MLILAVGHLTEQMIHSAVYNVAIAHPLLKRQPSGFVLMVKFQL